MAHGASCTECDPSAIATSLRDAAMPLAIYLLISGVVRPRPDTTNVGWLGGLVDHPFRWSDDVNRLLILLLVLLLVFGPKRLPEMGKQLGKGMREFKDSVTGDSKDDDDAVVQTLPPADPVVPAAPPAPEHAKQRERDTVS